MEVILASNPQAEAAKAVSDYLKAHFGKPVLLMLSGGSAFSLLDFVDIEKLGAHVTLAVVDERYSKDEEVNNFTQLEKTNFFAMSLKKDVKVISTKVQTNESLSDLAQRFENELHKWREENKEGVVIATLGIGPDGHTAGIFSGDYHVDFDGVNFVVGYSVPAEINQYTKRVTVTNTFLRNEVDVAIVYAVGSDKYAIIEKVISNFPESKKLPAYILKEMKSVKVFTQV